MNKSDHSDFVALAKIIKAHGLNGEVKIQLYFENSDTIRDNMKVTLIWSDGRERELNIEYIKYSIPRPRIKFREILTREDTDEIREAEICLPRNDLPETEEDEFYLQDLIGFEIIDENSQTLGLVSDVQIMPANDILVLDYQNKEVLIPMIDDIIKLIDFENNRIIIQVMDGLLDL